MAGKVAGNINLSLGLDTSDVKQAMRHVESDIKKATKAMEGATSSLFDTKEAMDDAQSYLDSLKKVNDQAEADYKKTMTAMLDDTDSAMSQAEAKIQEVFKLFAVGNSFNPGITAKAFPDTQSQVAEMERQLAALQKNKDQSQVGYLSNAQEISVSKLAQVYEVQLGLYRQATSAISSLTAEERQSIQAYQAITSELDSTGLAIDSLETKYQNLEVQVTKFESELEWLPYKLSTAKSEFDNLVGSANTLFQGSTFTSSLQELLKAPDNDGSFEYYFGSVVEAAEDAINAVSSKTNDATLIEPWVQLSQQFQQTGEKVVELSDRSSQLATAISSTESAMQTTLQQTNDLYAKRDELIAKQADARNAVINQVPESAKPVSSEEMKQAQTNVAEATQAFQNQQAVVQQLQAQIRQLQAEYNSFSQQKTALEDYNRRVIEHQRAVAQVKSAVSGWIMAQHPLTDAFNLMKKSISGAISTVMKLERAFVSLGKGAFNGVKSAISSLIGQLHKFNKSSQSTGFNAKKMFMTILKYGLGVRSVYFLFRKLRSVITDGFKALAKQSPEVNAALSELTSSLAYLKNAFVGAFAPILTYVAPMLSQFIQMLGNVMNTIGAFIASILGQKTFKKATFQLKDYAKGLDKTGSSASSAAKKMQTYLSGLDEVQRYTDDTDTGGGDAGGGGFADSPIDEETSAWANQFKDVLARIWQPFKESWELEGQNTINAAKFAFESLISLAKTLGKTWLDVWTNGSGTKMLVNIHQIIQNILTTVGNLAVQFEKAWNKNEVGKGILQAIFNIINTILGLINGITKATAEWAATVNFYPLLEAVRKLLDSINGLLEKISPIVQKLYEEIILPALTWLIETGLPKAIEWLSGFIDTITEDMPDADSVVTTLKETFQTMSDKFKKEWWPTIDEFIKNFRTDFGEFKDKFVNEYWPDIKKAVKEGLAKFEEFKKKFVEEYWPEIEEALKSLWTFWTETLWPIISEAIGWLIDNLPTILEKITEIINFISNHLGVIATLGALFIATFEAAKIVIFAGQVVKAFSLIKTALTGPGSVAAAAQTAQTALEGAAGAGTAVAEAGGEVAAGAEAAAGGTSLLGGAIQLLGLPALIGGLVVSAEKLNEMSDSARGGNGVLSEYSLTLGELENSLLASGAVTESQRDELFKLQNGIEDGTVTLDEYIETLNSYGISADQAKQITDNLKATYNLTDEQAGILDEVIANLTTTTEDYGLTGKEAYDKINQALTDMASEYPDAAGKIEVVRSVLEESYHDGSNASQMYEAVKNSVNQLGIEADNSVGFLDTLSEKTGIAGTTAEEASTQMGSKGLLGSVSGFIGATLAAAGLQKIADKNTNVAKETKGANKEFKDLEGHTSKYGTNTLGGFITGYKSKFTEFSSMLTDSVDLVKDSFTGPNGLNMHSPSKVTNDYGVNTIQGFVNGFVSKRQTILNEISKLITDIKTAFKTFTDSVSSIGAEMGTNLANSIKNSLSGLNNSLSIAGHNAAVSFANGITNVHIPMPQISVSSKAWANPETGQSGYSMSSSVKWLAQGAVIPPNSPFMAVLGDQKRGTNIETPENLLRQIMREELANRNDSSYNKGGNYQFTAQINRKTLFDEFIAEAKLRQVQSGRNPLELA